jgi:hypothetical protein
VQPHAYEEEEEVQSQAGEEEEVQSQAGEEKEVQSQAYEEEEVQARMIFLRSFPSQAWGFGFSLAPAFAFVPACVCSCSCVLRVLSMRGRCCKFARFCLWICARVVACAFLSSQ